LNGSAGHLLIGALCSRVTLKRYRHAPGHDPSALNQDCVPVTLPDFELRAGEVFAAEAWFDLVEPSSEGLVLVLESAAVLGAAWSYERDSKRPAGLIAANRNFGRVQAALSLLSHVGNTDDAAVCLRLADHDSHAVRWEAVRAAFALNHPDALELLRNASHDVHPDIREVALEALAQWS
jgi:HEAT repeat protein